MSIRKKIPPNIEEEVLTTSRRRCAICYCIDGDAREKRGQIAHLDKNPNNNKIDNLIYLCFTHHDQYDSKTSVSKNYTIHEVKKYRRKLYSKIGDILLIDAKPKAESNREVSSRSDELLVFCGRIKEYFGGYPSASEVSSNGRELVSDLKDKVLDFGHDEQIIQPLRDFQNRVHIVFDRLLHHEDTRESKKDMILTYELLKKAIMDKSRMSKAKEHNKNSSLTPEPPSIIKNIEWIRRYGRQHWKLLAIASFIIIAGWLSSLIVLEHPSTKKSSELNETILRRADELRREFRIAIENKKPPLSADDFTSVLNLINAIQQMDTNNGHAHYYSAEVKRWMNLREESHQDFYRYLDYASTLSDVLKNGGTSVEECYRRADGYCRQRTGWIHHLIALDFLSKGRRENNDRIKLSLFESSLNHANAAIEYFPGGFIHHTPTKALRDMLIKEIKSLNEVKNEIGRLKNTPNE